VHGTRGRERKKGEKLRDLEIIKLLELFFVINMNQRYKIKSLQHLCIMLNQINCNIPFFRKINLKINRFLENNEIFVIK